MNSDLFFLIFNLNGQFLILDKLMVFGADQLIYILTALIFLLGIKGGVREKVAFLLILLGIPIAFLFIKTVHIFFYEPRPFVTFNFTPNISEAANASFPSRHAAIASVIAFSYAYLKSKWAPFFLFITLWIGLSRIYVGVHYPLDIIGGFLVGAVALIISIQIKNLLRLYLLK